MAAPEQAWRPVLRGQRTVRIFVTVGSTLPFDRLVRAMDRWAEQHPSASVFAQIGAGGTPPMHMTHAEMVEPIEFRRHCAESDLIVSHVGMGTVMTAAEVQRPLVALPRRHRLREVNSEHQSASAVWLKDRQGVCIVESEAELASAIERMAGKCGPADFEGASRVQLCNVVREFLEAAINQRDREVEGWGK